MHLTLAASLLFVAGSVHAATISADARCGPNGNGETCLGSTFGACCSAYGWCGQSNDHCSSGCDPKYGTCSGQVNTSKKVSPDATCGGKTGYTCIASSFGNCCSAAGYCGSTNDYCSPDNGCQSDSGDCNVVKEAVSTDGRCGKDFNGITCWKSGFGNCCSANGYCGNTDAYCNLPACQAPYGDCAVTPPAPTSTPTTVPSTGPVCHHRSMIRSDAPAPYNTLYNFSYSSDQSCIKLCANDAKCKSSEYSNVNGGASGQHHFCSFYDVVASRLIDDAQKQGESVFIFNDKACGPAH